jgi:hypothetical protein
MTEPEAARLQWHNAGTLTHPDATGASWHKTKWEAEASWSTPHGPGRYRIWCEDSSTVIWSVVRLKPSTGTLPGGKPRKFSGYNLSIRRVRDMQEAMAIAERDNARLSQQERSSE